MGKEPYFRANRSNMKNTPKKKLSQKRQSAGTTDTNVFTI